MSDLPFRCTTCGGITQAVIKSAVGATSTEAALTQIDDRYAIRWCNWCKRKREAIQAESVKDAVSTTRTIKPSATAPPGTQIKGGW